MRLTYVLVPFVLTAVLSACGATDPEASLSIAPTQLTQIEQARKDCRLPASAVGDDGRTLLVDHKGEDDTDGLSMDQLVCALTALEVTDALVAQMGATRAMDGVQTGSWGRYTAVWSYHPDSGLDIVIEEAS